MPLCPLQTGDYTLMDLKVEAYDEEPEKEQHDIIGSAVAAPFLLLSDATRADTWVQVFDSQDNANGRVHLQFEPIGVEPLAGAVVFRGACPRSPVLLYNPSSLWQRCKARIQLLQLPCHISLLVPRCIWLSCLVV